MTDLTKTSHLNVGDTITTRWSSIELRAAHGANDNLAVGIFWHHPIDSGDTLTVVGTRGKSWIVRSAKYGTEMILRPSDLCNFHVITAR